MAEGSNAIEEKRESPDKKFPVPKSVNLRQCRCDIIGMSTTGPPIGEQ